MPHTAQCSSGDFFPACCQAIQEAAAACTAQSEIETQQSLNAPRTISLLEQGVQNVSSIGEQLELPEFDHTRDDEVHISMRKSMLYHNYRLRFHEGFMLRINVNDALKAAAGCSVWLCVCVCVFVLRLGAVCRIRTTTRRS